MRIIQKHCLSHSDLVLNVVRESSLRSCAQSLCDSHLHFYSPLSTATLKQFLKSRYLKLKQGLFTLQKSLYKTEIKLHLLPARAKTYSKHKKFRTLMSMETSQIYLFRKYHFSNSAFSLVLCKCSASPSLRVSRRGRFSSDVGSGASIFPAVLNRRPPPE